MEKQRVSSGAGTGTILSWECAQKVSWPKTILFVQISESGVGFGLSIDPRKEWDGVAVGRRAGFRVGGGSQLKRKSLLDAEPSSFCCKHVPVLNCFLHPGWGGWKHLLVSVCRDYKSLTFRTEDREGGVPPSRAGWSLLWGAETKGARCSGGWRRW